MSQATPFSGLLEMPDTGPPASDTDVQSVETGTGEPQSSGFKAFWENHQFMMMAIGLGVLLLTAVLVFRKSSASKNAANNTTTAGGGVPTVQTSDTAMAIDQQNNSIEALLNAFQQWTANNIPYKPGPVPPGDKNFHYTGSPGAIIGTDISGNFIHNPPGDVGVGIGSTVTPMKNISIPSTTTAVWGMSQAGSQPVVHVNTVDHTIVSVPTAASTNTPANISQASRGRMY